MLLSALVIVFIGLTISSLCSMLEACLLSLSHAEVAAMGTETRTGRIWAGFKRDVQLPLATILIVNTSAQTIATSFAAARFEALYGERGLIAFSIIISFVMIQWAEVLPKTLGSRHRRRGAGRFLPLRLARSRQRRPVNSRMTRMRTTSPTPPLG